MKFRNIFTLIIAFACTPILCLAQSERVTSTSNHLSPTAPSGGVVPFSLYDEGVRFHPIWGLDQAWISEQNFRKGINHMGISNVGIARTCFRNTKPLVNDIDLASDPVNALQRRNKIFDILSDTLPLVLTCDQEAGVDAYFRNGNVANIDRWAANIAAHVKWLKEHTKHRVSGASIFNEPDYWTEEGANTSNSRDIAKKLKSDYEVMNDVSIVGGNTLNDDKAITWYNGGKDYYDWGNTHQLAGSMNNYKAFYQLLARDGKVGYNDEMHNVAEAFIGLENGMTVGIWWGFDSRARGEFCDISRHGVRLGYADHPNNWTAATVYRHDDGRVKAFMGSSERQAYTTTYQFVCSDHEVYYDGVGPTREIQLTMHGGTGYQKGQKNAERVIDVTWGDDVQPSAIDGTYKIMNKATRMLVAEHGELNGNPNIAQTADNGKATTQWEVKPVGSSVDGDYSFYDIKSVNDGKHWDVLNFSTSSGANVISFGTGTPSTNQTWYLEYAGDGYYFIRNRESALYLTLTASNRIQGININQQARLDDPTRQLWRFLPLDAACETDAPATPSGLSATPLAAGVLLEWTPGTEDDLDGYMVLRAEKGSNQWNTIARKVKETKYLDNGCRQGKQYEYRLKAIDKSENQSAPCEALEASPTGAPSLTAHYPFNGDLNDATIHQMDGAAYGSPTFTTTKAEGDKSLSLNGTTQFVQLPYEVASSDELTFAAWVYWRNTSVPNQRIFDFGNGGDQYAYFTPSNGTGMAFVINDGTGEQKVESTTKLISSRWKHVAVSIGRDVTTLYIDGEPVGSSTSLTVLPADINTTLNFLGRSQQGSSSMLKANLDDVRIYNHALDAEGVKAAMNAATDHIISPDINPNFDNQQFYGVDGIAVKAETHKGVKVGKGGKKI